MTRSQWAGWLGVEGLPQAHSFFAALGLTGSPTALGWVDGLGLLSFVCHNNHSVVSRAGVIWLWVDVQRRLLRS